MFFVPPCKGEGGGLRTGMHSEREDCLNQASKNFILFIKKKSRNSDGCNNVIGALPINVRYKGNNILSYKRVI